MIAQVHRAARQQDVQPLGPVDEADQDRGRGERAPVLPAFGQHVGVEVVVAAPRAERARRRRAPAAGRGRRPEAGRDRRAVEGG